MRAQRYLLTTTFVLLAAAVCFSQRPQRGTGININKIRLGTEYVNGEVKGGYANQIFRPKDHVIYCVAGISNPSADARYRFVWLYYDPAQRAEKQIFEQELANQTEKDVVGKLSSTSDWPLGHYRVEIWVDGKRLAQRPMTIMKDE